MLPAIPTHNMSKSTRDSGGFKIQLRLQRVEKSCHKVYFAPLREIKWCKDLQNISSFFHSFTHAQIQSLYQKNFQKKILREFPWLIDYKIEFGEKSIMKIVSFTRAWFEDSWKKCWLGIKIRHKRAKSSLHNFEFCLCIYDETFWKVQG